MERLTFEGNFCDIAQCEGEYRMTSACADGACSQRKVWERLKQYEDTGMKPEDFVEMNNANAFQVDALRTVRGKDLLLEGVMGLAGEAGECIDIVKKYRFQGHALDPEHLAEELGDVAWYIAVTAHEIGYSLSDIFSMNKIKREQRYPNGFDPDRSVNREV